MKTRHHTMNALFATFFLSVAALGQRYPPAGVKDDKTRTRNTSLIEGMHRNYAPIGRPQVATVSLASAVARKYNFHPTDPQSVPTQGWHILGVHNEGTESGATRACGWRTLHACDGGWNSSASSLAHWMDQSELWQDRSGLLACMYCLCGDRSGRPSPWTFAGWRPEDWPSVVMAGGPTHSFDDKDQGDRDARSSGWGHWADPWHQFLRRTSHWLHIGCAGGLLLILDLLTLDIPHVILNVLT